MVQMSLLSEPDAIDVTSRLGEMADQARARGVPRHVVDRAVRATTARFGGVPDAGSGSTQRRRMRSYFEAVIRRSIMTATDAESRVLFQRLVTASIEADLRSAGWSRSRSTEEARRTLGVAANDAIAVG